MNFSKTLAIGLLALSATQALADAHGNKYAHSREFNGQTYMMYTQPTPKPESFGLRLCGSCR